MDDLFYLFAVLAIGIIIGWNLRESLARRRIERMLDELGQETTEKLLDSIINVTCEFHEDGSIFVYDKANGSYLGHAENADKLQAMLMDKFPGKYFNVSPEDLEKLQPK